MESSPLYKVLTISDIIRETNDFKTFIFEHSHDIVYESGQFLTLVHRNFSEDVRRSYSITSSPVLHEPLSIGVKRIPNGMFSRKLVDQTSVGDQVLTTGAGGFFKLPETLSAIDRIFFFAAGSGITPVLSLLKTVLYSHPRIKVVLVYSNHSPKSAVYLTHVHRLKSLFPQSLHIELLFGISRHLETARLTRDSLLALLERFGYDAIASLFYTCGPASYMRMVTYTLQERGVPSSSIRKEDFVPAASALPKAPPPDTGSYQATILYGSSRFIFPVNYPDTILRSARKHNISLPYSCETGKCGNCAATCLSGQIWLSANEVLTDEDLAKGLTLTCVGHPMHGDVILEIH